MRFVQRIGLGRWSRYREVWKYWISRLKNGSGGQKKTSVGRYIYSLGLVDSRLYTDIRVIYNVFMMEKSGNNYIVCYTSYINVNLDNNTYTDIISLKLTMKGIL